MSDWDIAGSSIGILLILLCIVDNPTDNTWIFLITLRDIADNGKKIVKPKLYD